MFSSLYLKQLPKSHSLHTPLGQTSTLLGFKSRCKIPLLWQYCKPLHMSKTKSTSILNVKLMLRSSRTLCNGLEPAQYSITTKQYVSLSLDSTSIVFTIFWWLKFKTCDSRMFFWRFMTLTATTSPKIDSKSTCYYGNAFPNN